MSSCAEVISELQTANKCQYESHMSEILTISTVTRKGKDHLSMSLGSQVNRKKNVFGRFNSSW